MKVGGNKIVLTISDIGGSLIAKGGDALIYFAIAGAYKRIVD